MPHPLLYWMDVYFGMKKLFLYYLLLLLSSPPPLHTLLFHLHPPTSSLCLSLVCGGEEDSSCLCNVVYETEKAARAKFFIVCHYVGT